MLKRAVTTLKQRHEARIDVCSTFFFNIYVLSGKGNSDFKFICFTTSLPVPLSVSVLLVNQAVTILKAILVRKSCEFQMNMATTVDEELCKFMQILRGNSKSSNHL